MKQQRTPSLNHSALFQPGPQTGGSGLTNPGRGNGGSQDRLRFINDLRAWVSTQREVIAGEDGPARMQRIYGVLSVAADASMAFQRGEEVDVASLPMAPTASQRPLMGLRMPGLSDVIQPILALGTSQPVQIAQAGAGGLGGLFSNTVFGGKGKDEGTEQSDTQASETAKKAVNGGGGGDVASSKRMSTLVSQIMALKLKLPGEKRTFSLKKYGDTTSAEKILKHCIQVGISSPDQVAYILATAWHESRLGKWMTESGWLSEKSAERYAEKKYGPNGSNPSRAKKMGNTKAGDGGRYMGRGYVQLTWKNNYKRMSDILIKDGFTYTQDGVTYGDGKNGTKRIDLVSNYKHVNRNKDLAARVLVLGMDGGHYVNNGKGLDHYIPEDKAAKQSDFESARRIVNGTDKKKLIAQNAVTIAAVLRKNSAWKTVFSDVHSEKPSGPR